MKQNVKELSNEPIYQKFIQGFPSFEEAWQKHEQGFALLRVAELILKGNPILVKASVLCVSQNKNLMKDKRSLKTLEAGLRYAEGDITESELSDIMFDASEAHDWFMCMNEYGDEDDMEERAAANVSDSVAEASEGAYREAAEAAYKAIRLSNPEHYIESEMWYSVCCASEAAKMAKHLFPDASEIDRKAAEICRETLTEAVMEVMK